MNRSAVMQYFDGDTNIEINQMWIGVRCFNIKRVPAWAWLAIAAGIALLVGLAAWKKSREF